jgi:hypothetical protein
VTWIPSIHETSGLEWYGSVRSTAVSQGWYRDHPNGVQLTNDRNISALVQVLRGAPGLPAGIPLEALAEHLAAAGVLYSVALTDDEAVKIGADASGVMLADRSEIALCVRQGLEKVLNRSSTLGLPLSDARPSIGIS